MKGAFVQSLPLLEYAVAGAPLPGQVESGDLHLVKETSRGALVALVDGSGHGAEAASVARLAVATLEAHAEEGVISLFRLCHQRLKHSRGAVMSLAVLDRIENTITWMGVGNIDGVLVRGSPLAPNGSIFAHPGVVGYRLPSLQATVTPIAAGDLLILTTDGIRADFVHSFGVDDQPGKIAEFISSNFHKGTDDGLVLVVRYLGPNE